MAVEAHPRADLQRPVGAWGPVPGSEAPPAQPYKVALQTGPAGGEPGSLAARRFFIELQGDLPGGLLQQPAV